MSSRWRRCWDQAPRIAALIACVLLAWQGVHTYLELRTLRAQHEQSEGVSQKSGISWAEPTLHAPANSHLMVVMIVATVDSLGKPYKDSVYLNGLISCHDDAGTLIDTFPVRQGNVVGKDSKAVLRIPIERALSAERYENATITLRVLDAHHNKAGR